MGYTLNTLIIILIELNEGKEIKFCHFEENIKKYLFNFQRHGLLSVYWKFYFYNDLKWFIFSDCKSRHLLATAYEEWHIVQTLIRLLLSNLTEGSSTIGILTICSCLFLWLCIAFIIVENAAMIFGNIYLYKTNDYIYQSRLLINFANSLDPDQARQSFELDLDQNFLTLWWYCWKNFSNKLILKKISRRQKFMKNLLLDLPTCTYPFRNWWIGTQQTKTF